MRIALFLPGYGPLSAWKESAWNWPSVRRAWRGRAQKTPSVRRARPGEKDLEPERLCPCDECAGKVSAVRPSARRFGPRGRSARRRGNRFQAALLAARRRGDRFQAALLAGGRPGQGPAARRRDARFWAHRTHAGRRDRHFSAVANNGQVDDRALHRPKARNRRAILSATNQGGPAWAIA